MRPSRIQIFLFSALFLSGLVACFLVSLKPLVLILGAFLLTLSLVDFILSFLKPRLKFQRDYQKRYAIGEQTKGSFTIVNRGKRTVAIRLYDGLPDYCVHDGFPHTETLKAGQYAHIGVVFTFTRRGDYIIQPAYAEWKSPLRFWWKSLRLGDPYPIQVFPNYVPAMQYALLATSDRLSQMGIIKKRDKGLSKEFHQLRDYQDGDPLTHMDWKASSRVNRLIAREFQVERDQNILLVADCSIRTSAIDGTLPILDHLLNSMILISYMALKQGDKVSLMNFGTPPSDHRYLAPVKGNAGVPKILDHLYNYQSSKSYGEYTNLAKHILTQQRKRSFIIILTNLRSEDQYGCVEALRLLSQKHLVLLASVQENSVTEILDNPIYTTADADRFLGASAYEQDAEAVAKDLMNEGIAVLRSPIESFGVDLANRYLDLRNVISA